MKRLRTLCVALVAALAACAAPQESSVKPGINDGYLDPEMPVDTWVSRFEVESREVYTNRAAIVAAIGLSPGDVVADVGAGTGLFEPLLAERVGPQGRVLALDISPKFVEHLTERVRNAGLENVEVRLSGERSVDLPEASIDVAFLCDVYHHLEYPRSSMESIRAALREGGRVVLVDFERIPGVTRDWLLEHVRAGKAEVLAEMASFGFELIEEPDVEGLEENYFVRFAKR